MCLRFRVFEKITLISQNHSNDPVIIKIAGSIYMRNFTRNCSNENSVENSYNMEWSEDLERFGGVNIQNLTPESLNEVYAELIDLIGMDNMLIIYTHYKGQQITYPVKLWSKDYIVKQIRNEYNGHNVGELATKYGYSDRWIRKIVNDK